MTEALNRGFLGGTENAPCRRNQQVLIGATVMGLLFSAGFVGSFLGNVSSTSEAEIGSEVSASTKPIDLADTVVFDEKCYGFTGGTCTLLACHDERKARCYGGYCECAGGCTGADGNCRHNIKQYTRIASRVTFSPLRYPDYWLHVQAASGFNTWNQLRIENSKTWSWTGQQLFDIYKLPGHSSELGQKRYFIASHKFPNWVAAIMGGSQLKGRAHTFSLYAKNLNWPTLPWDPMKVTLHICSFGGNVSVVKIGRAVTDVYFDYKTEWAYAHNFSWFVDATGIIKSAGDGGHWFVSDEENRAVGMHVDPC